MYRSRYFLVSSLLFVWLELFHLAANMCNFLPNTLSKMDWEVNKSSVSSYPLLLVADDFRYNIFLWGELIFVVVAAMDPPVLLFSSLIIDILSSTYLMVKAASNRFAGIMENAVLSDYLLWGMKKYPSLVLILWVILQVPWCLYHQIVVMLVYLGRISEAVWLLSQ